jgi:hypothetical protein
VLAPFAVAGCLVVNSSQEPELLNWNLLLLDAEFVVQLALSGALDTLDGIGQDRASLARDTQRVRAAGVCPHVGKRDLLGGALLKEQFILVVEQEDGKRPVEEPLVDVGHEMADLLAGVTDGQVILIDDNADLIHEADLLLIVAGKSLGAGVDVGEQTQHVLGRDGLRRLGDGCGGRHVWGL